MLKKKNTVQGVATKNIPKKKKCNQAKQLSEKALQIAEERREEKGKGERERYTQMNVEFQTIMRRNKKALLNDQCKEIEKKYIMAKSRDLFKKTGDIKGTFHARLGMIKKRNGKDLTEEEIKKRVQEYRRTIHTQKRS